MQLTATLVASQRNVEHCQSVAGPIYINLKSYRGHGISNLALNYLKGYEIHSETPKQTIPYSQIIVRFSTGFKVSLGLQYKQQTQLLYKRRL